MARTLRMPDEAELPDGTIRDFVDLLFFFYKEAHRPTLREISERIRQSGHPGTASTETIRRMLRGTTVPANWETVEAVLVILSDLAGRDPNGKLTYEHTHGTRRSHLERLWHEALDYPDFHRAPAGLHEALDDDRTRAELDDPWETVGYPADPPF
jgi:hypothetical protein